MTLIPLIQELAASAEPETFSEEGFSITLTNKFEREEDETFDVCYASNAVGITVEKISMGLVDFPSMKAFAESCADSDPDRYTTTKEVTKYGKLMWYEYETKIGFTTYHYAAYFYENQGYYYLFTFGVEQDDFAKYSADIDTWASSVTFE